MTREDMFDCDDEKARLRGGWCSKMPWTLVNKKGRTMDNNETPVSVPTPADEPDVETRRIIAWRVPADRILSIPTSDQEPDDDVRRTIAERVACSACDA